MSKMTRPDLLNCIWDYQNQHGHLTDEFVENCAKRLDISQIEIEGVISFYHFFKRKKSAEFTIYLNKSIISETKGYQRVKEAFERETGTTFGHIDPSGKFGLYVTACIGLNDQEPAALINFHPFTNLTSLKVKQIVADLKNGRSVESICDEIQENIRHTPDPDKTLLLRDYIPGKTVLKIDSLGKNEMLNEVKESGIRGMGGAYFPTALKMESCMKEKSKKKYVVCNADEGEPGTFKDRILLHKYPGLLLEGMIAAGYIIGSDEGVIYLRAEYQWLLDDLNQTIEDFEKRNFLGKNVAGIDGFDFKIRVQLGAGSYVCGEETALLNSMEGKRGEPRNKLYFPTQRGFLDKPTLVNNVETFCAVARSIELGSNTFKNTGTKTSPGTKLISVSGDCQFPGIYEVEWGTKVSTILDMCRADDAYYVQISGPSGQAISKAEFDREISMDDLRCGGSFMIFNSKRDILKILRNFTNFFKQESCGVCTPCRAGNFIIERKLEKISNGLAYKSDYDEIKQWGNIMKHTSRCGLGQAATNALSLAIDKFPEYFDAKVEHEVEGMNEKFNMDKALEPYEKFSD